MSIESIDQAKGKKSRQSAQAVLDPGSCLHDSLKDLSQLEALVLDTLGDGIIILAPDHRILYQNKLHRNRFGSRQGEFCYRAVHGREVVCEGCPVKQCFATGEICVCERQVTVQDETIYNEVTASPIWEGGRVTAVIEIVREITERKKMQLALQESEATLKGILTAAPLGIAMVDGDQIFRWVNENMKQMLGYQEEELLGRCASEVYISQEEFNRVRGAKLCQIDQQGIGEAETRWRRKDGRVIDVLLRSAPLTAEEPKSAMICTVLDITDRKNAEQQMRLFLDLVDQSNDALSVLDLETGYISLVNEKFCRDLQYTREELLTMRPEDFSVKSSDYFKCHFNELKKMGTRLEEDCHRRKDGSTFPVEVNVKYTVINHREFVVGVIRDISERRKQEAEMLRAEKLESLGVLAGGIAHDFNNMLTGIRGNLSLAKDLLGERAGVYELVAEANAAASEAQNLTKQLLTFAKGGQPVKKMLSLRDLLVDTARFALRGSNVRCEFRVADGLRQVSGDAGQLGQVIQNLVLNADQAMPEGGAIRITAENEELPPGFPLPLKAGSYVRIQVQDQGVGVLPQHLPKIFDPYFSTKKKGSGLGLASVYSVIRKHGGVVTVESEVGKGSVFTVRLPAAEGHTTAIKQKTTEKIRGGKGRILVMDDEEQVRKIAVRMLRRLGYQAESVEDGRQALELYGKARCQGAPFDAVLMDLTVPGGMGGKQAIAELQKLDPEVRAIVSSGYTNDDLMANYLRHGFRGVVPKPYDLTELSQVLTEVLGSAGEEGGLPEYKMFK